MAEVAFMRLLTSLDLNQARRRDRGQPCSRTLDCFWKGCVEIAAHSGIIWSATGRLTTLATSGLIQIKGTGALHRGYFGHRGFS